MWVHVNGWIKLPHGAQIYHEAESGSRNKRTWEAAAQSSEDPPAHETRDWASRGWRSYEETETGATQPIQDQPTDIEVDNDGPIEQKSKHQRMTYPCDSWEQDSWDKEAWWKWRGWHDWNESYPSAENDPEANPNPEGVSYTDTALADALESMQLTPEIPMPPMPSDSSAALPLPSVTTSDAPDLVLPPAATAAAAAPASSSSGDLALSPTGSESQLPMASGDGVHTPFKLHLLKHKNKESKKRKGQRNDKHK